MVMQQKRKKNSGTGRKPKKDPAVFRYSVSFNAADHDRFLTLFEQSGMQVKAHFIASCIFNRPIKVVKIDKAAMDYYMRLTTLYAQFRGIGTNYNQVVKALKSHFSEKKALAFLFKLEKATLELIKINQEIIQLTREFEEKWLQK